MNPGTASGWGGAAAGGGGERGRYPAGRLRMSGKGKKTAAPADDRKVVVANRKARHEYTIDETVEAGE